MLERAKQISIKSIEDYWKADLFLKEVRKLEKEYNAMDEADRKNFLIQNEYIKQEEEAEAEKERYIDWLPREDVYEVIKYEYKKWYLVRSTIDWIYKRIDTWDNKNSKKFYKLKYHE